ncbi:MAG TPA: helix-turn-helix domain-containing protein [Thermoanaerobaculia bacterium]|jgi:transcriptional regulator with XRE-family HTH domain
MTERSRPNRSEEAEDRRMCVCLVILLGKWSRTEVAAAMGVSRSSLTRYMGGIHAPTPKTFQQIAAALGFSSSAEEILRHVRALRRLLVGEPLPPGLPEGTGGAELGRAFETLLRDVWWERWWER